MVKYNLYVHIRKVETMDIRCQQFTSYDISDEMLNMVDYKANLYGKKVLENSCGEGNILGLVVERYILSALAEERPLNMIKQGLEEDIFGVEIVKDTYNICISNLNQIAQKYNLAGVKWNIIRDDVLTNPFKITFDYVIGNPPYISYRNLELGVREYIKDNYATCEKGKPDYCYAFIENAINYLHKSGKMAYLIPNSIFKNVFGKKLRSMILPHLVELYDYPNCKLFEKALTSSAIMILEKESNKKKFQYYNVVRDYGLELEKNRLSDKWMFNLQTPIKIKSEEMITFENFFKASITIATQRNKIFVIDEKTKENYKIESRILRKAISPRNHKYKNIEYIIFPYRISRGVVYRYEEEDFKDKYPNAYRYLRENKEELELRDADSSAKWFEYGRSQAIQNMNKKKMLVSTVATNAINSYEVDARAIPYSGIYIISEHGSNLSLAKNILESSQFFEYVKGIGTPASGSSLRITADDINQFRFKREELFKWLK